MLAVAHDPAPADHHVAHVGRPGREHRRLDEVVGRGAGQADAVEADDGQVGERADAEVTGVGPTERARAARRGRGQEVGGGVVAADAGGQPGIELHGPGLLEQVDHRVGVGPEAQPRAGRDERGRGTDAVGQVPLGRRAEADGGTAEGRDVGGGEVGGVDGGEPPADQAGPGQDLDGRPAVGGGAVLVLGRLLADVGVQRRAPLVGPPAHDRHLLRRDGTDRVDRGAGHGPCATSPRPTPAPPTAPASPSEKRCCTSFGGRPIPPCR